MEMPKDIQFIQEILKSSNVEYDSEIIPSLLDFYHRYISEILLKAQNYQEYRSKTTGGDNRMKLEDVKLAVDNINEYQFTSRQRIFQLQKYAEIINSQKIQGVGQDIAYPSEHDSLTKPNERIEIKYSKE